METSLKICSAISEQARDEGSCVSGDAEHPNVDKASRSACALHIQHSPSNGACVAAPRDGEQWQNEDVQKTITKCGNSQKQSEKAGRQTCPQTSDKSSGSKQQTRRKIEQKKS